MTITGLDKVIKNYSNAPQFLENELGKALEKSLLVIEKNVKVRTPVDTGRLRSSIGNENESEGWKWVKKNLASIGTRVEYAYHVEVTKMRHRVGEAGYFSKGVKASVEQIHKFFVDGINNLVRNITS